ncbi:MAG: DUF5683 domain-containing protein [Ferruginibacter sp.]|nr:DUF5683 domain-containing protein [Ferruginibacter sp.]
MQKTLFIFSFLFLFFGNNQIFAQVVKDTVPKASTTTPDTTLASPVKKKHDPRVATIRSAIIPGWGQIYNKKYWKLPLVYGALGTTAGVFFYNTKNYKLLRAAYIYRTDKDTTNDKLIEAKFQVLSTGALRTNRDLFRQNVDYSVLFFILFWGLNVVDATIDGHLKEFDVSDNISFHITPGLSDMANTTGLSLVFDIHSRKFKRAK